jgi:hypothetical protein
LGGGGWSTENLHTLQALVSKNKQARSAFSPQNLYKNNFIKEEGLKKAKLH